MAKTNIQKTAPKRKITKTTQKKLKIDYEEFLSEVSLDEERILANLAFDPIIIGKQLQENHFTSSDFQGLEANKILLSAMLELLEDGSEINFSNLYDLLKNKKRGNNTLLQLAGNETRLQKLFISPFSSPGVTMMEDVEPLIEKIRDRKIRREAHRVFIEYSEKVIIEAKDVFETLSSGIQNLRNIFLQGSLSHINSLDIYLSEMQELIEVNRSKNRSYLGYNTNFPILSDRLGGFLKEFYLITGGVGMGKSSFAAQMAWDLATLNPELTVVFFSLDLNRFDVTSKIVAQSAQIPIDYVRNPYFEREDLEARRLAALSLISNMKDRFFLLDESSGRFFIEDIKKQVKRIRLSSANEVAVVIDPIFKIQVRGQHNMPFDERCNYLAAELKSLSAVEGVTIIATAGLPKAISNRRPVREDLEELMGLLYDPYAVFFLYSDYLNNFDTPFLEWEWGKEDSFMIPISEALIAKNKMGTINSRIFFRYFEAYSKYKECAPQEVENYTAMIDNIEKFKDQQNTMSANRKASRSEEF